MSSATTNLPAIERAGVAERDAFEHLLEQVLAPLMPLAITYGMKANDITLATRAVYLRVMETRLQRERGHDISDARLALVTSLTRREVALARKGAAGREAVVTESTDQLSRIAVVLTAWHTNPRFSGAYGVPLDLDLEPNEGSAHRSFAELIQTACAGLPQLVTLDELIAHGVAEVVGGTLVRCKTRAAISNSKSSSGKEDLLAQYGIFLARVSGTVAYNVLRDVGTEGYFDRLLVSDLPLSQRTRQQFQKRAMNATDAFLSELDSWLSKSAGGPTESSDRRFGVGVFFYEEDRDATEVGRGTGRKN